MAKQTIKCQSRDAVNNCNDGEHQEKEENEEDET